MKEYRITTASSLEDFKQVTVKESDLTKEQQDLILAELIKTFDASPRKVQIDFVSMVWSKRVRVVCAKFNSPMQEPSDEDVCLICGKTKSVH